MELLAGAGGEASEDDLTGVVAGDTLEVFLVERLDGVTVADAAEAALADLLDEDGGGV